MRRVVWVLYFAVIAISGLPFARSIWLGAVEAESPPFVDSTTPCAAEPRALFDELWRVYADDAKVPASERVSLAMHSLYLGFDGRVAASLQRCSAQREQLLAVQQLRHALATNAGLLRQTQGELIAKILGP